MGLWYFLCVWRSEYRTMAYQLSELSEYWLSDQWTKKTIRYWLSDKWTKEIIRYWLSDQWTKKIILYWLSYKWTMKIIRYWFSDQWTKKTIRLLDIGFKTRRISDKKFKFNKPIVWSALVVCISYITNIYKIDRNLANFFGQCISCPI